MGKNDGLKRLNNRRRRAKKRTIIKRHGPWCYYCGGAIVYQMTTLDHVVPVSKGGRNANSNLVPSCYPCNQKKGSKL